MISEEEFDELRAQTEKAYLSKIKMEKIALVIYTMVLLVCLGIYLYGFTKHRTD